MSSSKQFPILLNEVRSCTVCEKHLHLGANPILQGSTSSKIIIIGQAPGKKVHESGIPWNDPSGDRLRSWMGIEKEIFYDESQIALIPMGFCYPGKGKSGDLPPRPECAPLWHEKLINLMPQRKIVLLIGKYSQGYYLIERQKENLTKTVQAYQEYLPDFLPLPHPSPRNNIWLQKNPWFEEIIIFLQKQIQEILR